MEHSRLDRLRASFGDVLTEREVVCLDIPDDFAYVDPKLVECLTLALVEHLP